MPRNVCIVGATSAISEQVARLFAEEGANLILMGRDSSRVQQVAEDLSVRGAKSVRKEILDLADVSQHEIKVSDLFADYKTIDVVFVCYGILPDQKKCDENLEELKTTFHVNFMSQASWAKEFSEKMKIQRSGTLAVVSSVAGDRGRKSNYAYGASKGALTLWLQGLRSALYPFNVKVMTIKPGWIDTPMTAQMKKGNLFTSPQKAGRKIYQAILKGREVVYVPEFWRFIMFAVRAVPEAVFKRGSL